jgi:hypothetical protein
MSEKLNSDQKTVEQKIRLGVGIFLFPYIFSWFTLRKGYSSRFRLIAFLWLFFLAFAIYSSEKRSSSPKASKNVAQATKRNPNLFPTGHHPEAAAIDALTLLSNMQIHLKGMNRYKIYSFIQEAKNTIGYSCTHDVCHSTRMAVNALERAVKDLNDVSQVHYTGEMVREAAKAGELFRRSETYKITQRKPLWKSDDGMYGIEAAPSSLEQCKIWGDAINLTKKFAIVVFVKPGAKVSRNVASSELDNVSCIYRRNFAGKGYTQVLMGADLEKEWKF